MAQRTWYIPEEDQDPSEGPCANGPEKLAERAADVLHILPVDVHGLRRRLHVVEEVRVGEQDLPRSKKWAVLRKGIIVAAVAVSKNMRKIKKRSSTQELDEDSKT